MNIVVTGLISLILLLNSGVYPAANPVQYTETEPSGSISGRITCIEDGQEVLLAGVPVYALSTTTKYVEEFTDTTDADGLYHITNLPADNYTVYTHTSETDLNYIEQGNGPVVVEAGTNTPGIDFILEVGGTITGNVSWLDGGVPVPLEGMRLYVRNKDKGNYISNTYTDAEGNYTLGQMDTGNYSVCVDDPYSEDSVFLSEWYNDKAYFEESDAIEVTQGVATPGIDFTLEKGDTLSGTVSYYENGNLLPLENARVITEAPICIPVVVVPPADTPETTGIDFSLDEGGFISGYVYESDGSTPVSDATICVRKNRG